MANRHVFTSEEARIAQALRKARRGGEIATPRTCEDCGLPFPSGREYAAHRCSAKGGTFPRRDRKKSDTLG